MFRIIVNVEYPLSVRLTLLVTVSGVGIYGKNEFD